MDCATLAGWLSELSILKFAESLNHFSWSFVCFKKRVKRHFFSFELKKIVSQVYKPYAEL